MGGSVACIPDECAADGSRPCRSGTGDSSAPCRFDLENAFESIVAERHGLWSSGSLDLEVTTISKDHLSLRLSRLAEREEDDEVAEGYAATLNRVLDVLVSPKQIASQLRARRESAGGFAAVMVVVAPEEDMREYLDYSEPDVVVLTREPEQGFRVHAEQFRRRLEEGHAVSQAMESQATTFAVSHCSGEVLTGEARFLRSRSAGMWCAMEEPARADAAEPLGAAEVAAALGRGVVFERTCEGEVFVYPASDVERAQAWHVCSPGQEPSAAEAQAPQASRGSFGSR